MWTVAAGALGFKTYGPGSLDSRGKTARRLGFLRRRVRVVLGQRVSIPTTRVLDALATIALHLAGWTALPEDKNSQDRLLKQGEGKWIPEELTVGNAERPAELLPFHAANRQMVAMGQRVPEAGRQQAPVDRLQEKWLVVWGDV